jgi:hypothetical protein
MNKYTLGCGFGSAQPPRVERSRNREPLRKEKTRLMGIFFIGNHLTTGARCEYIEMYNLILNSLVN